VKKNIGIRAICLLLAGYVLLLAIMPCMDDVTNHGKVTRLPGISLSMPGHAVHPDCCSPFCSCSCCNIAMEVTPGCVVCGLVILPQKFIFPVNRHLLSDYSFVAWEPPKA